MRIVIDLQGAQTESRFRGIGRYTLSFAQAIVRNRGEHEVILALSALTPDTIETIRAAFDDLLPQENIRVWYAPGPVRECEPGNQGRCETAELIREAFLASLKPDVIHVTSLFEGYIDDAVTSIGRFDRTTPVTVSLYDLIPLLDPELYLKPDPGYAQYYQRKVEYLKKASAYLAISETAAREVTQVLALGGASVVNIAPTSDLKHQHASAQSKFQCVEEDDLAATVSACEPEFWNRCAGNAIAAFVELVERTPKSFPAAITKSTRPRLAFVSPLPPERTGIADYSAELLPALAVHYDIDVVVVQDRVDDPWVNRHLHVRDVAWLRVHAGEIDRVFYHVGNSPFHHHMLPLIREIPGTIVLHDFYLGHLMAWLEHKGMAHYWTNAVYSAHGYSGVRDRYSDPVAAQLEYPANLEVLQYALGVIVHSDYSRNLVSKWYGKGFESTWESIPLLRAPVGQFDKTSARKLLGIAANDFVVCSFGLLGPTKINHRLLACWLNSALANDGHCQLVFVGENHACEYGAELLKAIRSSECSDRIRITGFAAPETFRQYLMAADVAVQLRTRSRGETSAAVLDCMNFALPLIVNANGSMAELDPEAVWLLPDEFDDGALIEALDTLWREPARRRTLGERAREVILSRHAPAECAQRYADAIERFYRRAETASPALIRAISSQKQFVPNDFDVISLAKDISANLPLQRPAKRLFLDVSITCHDDFKTGIQRVVRALLLALLEAPPTGYRIEPVYLSNVGGKWHYRYACGYTLGLLGCPPVALHDECVEPEPGDVLLGLDLSGDLLVHAESDGLFADFRNRGVTVYSLVYDLLPVRMPDVFPQSSSFHHGRWLRAISTFDGAICISKAVAVDLAEWQAEASSDWTNRRSFRANWFHLGADLANSAPSRGLPNNAEWVLHQLRGRRSFLLVGTIEPRKGYLQTIEAFSEVLGEGTDINLVIVGKEGWNGIPDDMRRDIPQTVDHLRTHPELNKRLFWLEGISDEYLEKVYAACTCLIAASYGEGFGLPLIEAAQHKLPIIARDIPVFREVAGEHAYYFNGKTPGDLAQAISRWLALHSKDQHPKSDNIPWLTWEQSAQQLLKVVLPANAFEP